LDAVELLLKLAENQDEAAKQKVADMVARLTNMVRSL
jgi:hypothetical protein